MKTEIMNREIKFKVFWNKKMYYDARVGYTMAAFILPGAGIWKEVSLAECTPLQFTGLTDKNGKEIFEGDIMKGDFTQPLKVIFENGCFCFENDNLSENDRLHQFRTSKLEIIGNIYEHSHIFDNI